MPQTDTQHTTRNTLEFSIEGMDCADCARTIEKAVGALPGVGSATVNFGAARLSIQPASDNPDSLAGVVERKVSEAGYRATPMRAVAALAQVPYWRRERRVVTGAVAAGFALVAFILSFTSVPAWVINTLFAVSIIIGGLGFARAGLLALRSMRADMNLLMTIAVIGAAAIGDWGEAATVVLLFAFGGILQSYTLDRTRGAIRSLMSIAPATALVRRLDRSSGLPMAREIRMPVEDVAVGEAVIIGPGERLPLDGLVVSGASSVDQSAITGESVPVDVETGSQVFAGTINGHGLLTVKVTKAAGDSTLSHIISMVEEAQGRRAPSQQLVDRFSAVYTPVVIAGALLVAIVPPLLFGQLFSAWFYRALVMLVVACPCALVISTPVSIVAAIGAATRRGVLIKGGSTLEELGRVRVVAFDKTGTLTMGLPRVVSVDALDGDSTHLLQLAAAAESRSEHPLARAMVHASRESRNGAPLPDGSDFMAFPGLGARAMIDGQEIYVGNARFFGEKGISVDGMTSRLEELNAEGKTAVLVGTPTKTLGVIALADSARPEARLSIEKLHRAGVKEVTMLTGDNPRTAASIASSLGVDSYRAGLLPADKVEAVRRLHDDHGSVAMVGDGINDATALATADVGIAMGLAGTDAALEVADVALMSDDLSRLDFAILLSRRAVRVIKQNISVSLAVKALALILAVVGTLPLWGAILADMGVSLLVTLNGMTLLAYKGD